MTVKRLSTSGSSVTPSTIYPDLLAGYGDFGALQRIAYQTVTGSTTTDVTFNNIPQTYQDLMLVSYARSSDANTIRTMYITPYYSGIGSTVQSDTYLYGDGTSAASGRHTNQDGVFDGIVPGASATSGIFGVNVFHILNYANTSTYKTSLTRSAADINGSGQVRLTVALTRGTGGITTINCNFFSGSVYFAVGSTFELFGVKASNA